VVVLLLGLFILQAVTSLQRKFTTFDEPFYLVGGYSYLVTGDTRMVNRYHPPLAQVLVALPLLRLGLSSPTKDPAWASIADDFSSRVLAMNFLYDNSVPWEDILTPARLMMVALGVVIGLVVFLWAYELWGTAAGLLALAVYAFSPNILAHARLATTDFAVTGMSLSACYLLWRFYRRPGALRVLAAGVVLGLALLAKISALIFALGLIPLAVLYVLAPPAEGTPRKGRYGRLDDALSCSCLRRGLLALIATVAIYLVASGCLWLAFPSVKSEGTRAEAIGNVCMEAGLSEGSGASGAGLSLPRRALRAALPLIPWPKEYWQLVGWLTAKSETGHPGFLAGKHSQTGWWYFFPVVLAIKTPLPLLLLFSVALFLGWSRERLFDRLFLLIPPALFLALSMQAKINIGYRHVLPVLPFAIVYASQVASWALGRGWSRLRWVALGLLVVWQVAGTVLIWPNYLAYFNEAVGGPGQGYRYLADSNLDWGQDLLQLRDYVEANHVEKVHLAYFGAATPKVVADLGIPYEPVAGRGQDPPEAGVYAVSATRLQGVYGLATLSDDAKRPFPWLRTLTPEAKIGYTIFVYRVTEADAERFKEQAQ
jgi:hypothetical protein